MTSAAKAIFVSEEDLLRADLYDFLGALFSAPPSKSLLQKTSALSGDDSDLGVAIGTLAKISKSMTVASAEREFNALFVGLARGELLPYASYYLTGFLHEKPLAALRKDMIGLGLERAPNVFEPEDNIASLCEAMAALIRGRFGEPLAIDRQKDFFNKHLAPWAGHFFNDLEEAKNSVLYTPVGSVGRLFMDIEKEAFRMTGETPA